MQIKNKQTKEVYTVTGSVNVQSDQAVERLQDDEGFVYVNYSIENADGQVLTTSIKEGETENETYILL